MLSSRHAYFLSVICDASHREPNVTSGHKRPIPQKFYAQGSDIYRSVAPKFLLFCNKTILKAHNCCGYINMIAQSRLLLFKLKSVIFFPLVSTGYHFITLKKNSKILHWRHYESPQFPQLRITTTDTIYHTRRHKLWATKKLN